MSKPHPILLGLLSLPLFVSSPRAQCGGNGAAILQFAEVVDWPTRAGSKMKLKFIGNADSFVELVCDVDDGPHKFWFGLLCIELVPGFLDVDLWLNQYGRAEIPIVVPFFNCQKRICCQWIGVNPRTLELALSNAICMNLGEKCVGGVHELEYLTSFDLPASFPTLVVSAFGKADLSRLHGSTRIPFDPTKPPILPVTDDGKTFIEKIQIVDNKLWVLTRINNGLDSRGDRLGFPSLDTAFVVTAGSVQNKEVIHVSCSKPIGVGMTFGKHLITGLVSKGTTGCKCEGGINKLGYITKLKAPTQYPVTVVSSAAKDAATPWYKTSVSYDPANPPKFPVTDDGHLYITNIYVFGDYLRVETLIDNGKNSKNELLKFPGAEGDFTVTAGPSQVRERIHVSCSQPIQVGSIFGDHRITELVDIGR